MQKKDNRNLIVVIILSAVLGFAAGFVGSLIAGNFISGGYFGAPFFGEINFGEGQGREIIIRDPKNVIVEQNDRATETIASAKGSLAGIFKKISLPEKEAETAEINLSEYYKLGQEAGEGMIITSDGWVVSSFAPENLNYVIITQDKKIYSIDKIEKDDLTGFNFIHIVAKDLPVLRFAERSGIKSGQLALAVDWQGDSILTSIMDAKNTGDNFLFFSDSFPDEIILTDEFKNDFGGQFIFNLSGEVVGAFDGDRKIRPISHLEGAISSLLKNKEISRPVLGVNYIDLSRIISARPDATNKNGALIYKNLLGVSVVFPSPAQRADLKEGDIIISVDGITLDYNNNLTDVIQRFAAGSMVDVVYMRDGEEGEAEVSL